MKAFVLNSVELTKEMHDSEKTHASHRIFTLMERNIETRGPEGPEALT